MASYKDWLNIEKPNELSERELRKAVSSMASAANKRLKRFEKAGIQYGNTHLGGEIISGVRKFGVKDKSYDDVKREFTRVRNFLMSPQSSLTGMYRELRKFEDMTKKYHRLNRKEQKEYNKMLKQKKTSGIDNNSGKRMSKYEKLKRWRDTWDYYNRLVEEGYYAPTEYDSKQKRDVVYAMVHYSYEYELTEEETWERILMELGYAYEQAEEEDINKSTGTDTSSFFSTGSSD